MAMTHRLPDQVVVRADPWTSFCSECAQKMRIVTASPAEKGRETRTFECACGHRESINGAVHSLSRPAASARISTARTTKDRANPLQPSVRDAMLAAVPNLRAFAISLSRNVDRADDLVQEVGTIGLENPHRPRRADTVAVQEHHDFPHRLLLCQAARMLAARTGPMPSTSRSRSGVASMTSNTFSPKARTSFFA
jgi:hypothetical protein